MDDDWHRLALDRHTAGSITGKRTSAQRDC